ncbi:RNA-binding protein 7 isoform X2 [Phaenicophaeus curvirostris]|uniref:RNA-binding protein 7 isoform X2 n=1 Tax=Phaenicophaeus curvirostris TaxID=33595 RepID=UPI0037F0ADCE
MGAAAAEADRTLFVGNLDPKVTEELIFELFHQAGPVIKVKIPKDRDGRPKQFAFVNFKHEESVPYGLSLLNGIKLFGRPIKIQFRAGSSHASQDGNSVSSPHGAAGNAPSGSPHPAPTCGRYDRIPDSTVAAGFSAQRPLPTADGLPRQAPMHGAARQQPPAFALPGAFQHAPHTFHPALASQPPRRPELPSQRKGRLSAHPYHFAREQRFGERGSEFCRGGREDYGFEERGHDPEHRYREPIYDERHRDGWSHDYDYRRESYREVKWHPSRH